MSILFYFLFLDSLDSTFHCFWVLAFSSSYITYPHRSIPCLHLASIIAYYYLPVFPFQSSCIFKANLPNKNPPLLEPELENPRGLLMCACGCVEGHSCSLKLHEGFSVVMSLPCL